MSMESEDIYGDSRLLFTACSAKMFDLGDFTPDLHHFTSQSPYDPLLVHTYAVCSTSCISTFGCGIWEHSAWPVQNEAVVSLAIISLAIISPAIFHFPLFRLSLQSISVIRPQLVCPPLKLMLSCNVLWSLKTIFTAGNSVIASTFKCILSRLIRALFQSTIASAAGGKGSRRYHFILIKWPDLSTGYWCWHIKKVKTRRRCHCTTNFRWNDTSVFIPCTENVLHTVKTTYDGHILSDTKCGKISAVMNESLFKVNLLLRCGDQWLLIMCLTNGQSLYFHFMHPMTFSSTEQ